MFKTANDVLVTVAGEYPAGGVIAKVKVPLFAGPMPCSQNW